MDLTLIFKITPEKDGKNINKFFSQGSQVHLGGFEVGGFNCIFCSKCLLYLFKGLFCLHNVWGLI